MTEALVSMEARVTRRKEFHLAKPGLHPKHARFVTKMAKQVIETLVTRKNCGGEELRCWLDQFAIGNGFDVCCGNFKVGGPNTIGIDPADDVCGPTHNFRAEDLSFFEDNTQDHVVCNYIDGLMNILVALQEWHRVLKPGGTLAVVATNAEAHTVDGDILQNHRRSLYTAHTLEQYLHKVFQGATVIKHKSFLLATTTKPGS